MYPVHSKFTAMEHRPGEAPWDFGWPASLPASPTAHGPGCLAKLVIMAERAARREQLFHPSDGHARHPVCCCRPLRGMVAVLVVPVAGRPALARRVRE